jgi:hypothetical protein
MDLFTSPLEDDEMSLRELAMPSMENIEMQKSDLVLAKTRGVGRIQILGGKLDLRGATLPNFKLKSTKFTDFCTNFLIFTMEICCFLEH